MRTCRRGVFETNSSSSHSVTISKLDDIELLSEGNLYPSFLDRYEISVGEGWTLYCDTFEKKLSLLCHWLMHYNDEENKINIDSWFSYICEKTGINNIIPFRYKYTCFYEYFTVFEPVDGLISKENVDDLLTIVMDNSRAINVANEVW